MKPTDPSADMPIDRLMHLIERLRAKDGCPWDRKQTPASMVIFLLEEAHELAEAIASGNPEHIREEAGDVLFQLLFIVYLYAEQRSFDLHQVGAAITAKMIRRHPHVFGDAEVADADGVHKQWQKIKQNEKKANKAPNGLQSVLDSVPSGLPALMRTFRISQRAAATGFDWDDLAGVMDKVEEEWQEFRQEVRARQAGAGNMEPMAKEFGDLMFTMINVARLARLHPETALRKSLNKFEERFRYMESAFARKGLDVAGVTQAEREEMWAEAKSILG